MKFCAKEIVIRLCIYLTHAAKFLQHKALYRKVYCHKEDGLIHFNITVVFQIADT